jgi:hypothetical protein
MSIYFSVCVVIDLRLQNEKYLVLQMYLITGHISVQRCILSVYRSDLSTDMYFICLQVISQYRDVFYLFTGHISVQRCILSVYRSDLSTEMYFICLQVRSQYRDVFCLFTGQS